MKLLYMPIFLIHQHVSYAQHVNFNGNGKFTTSLKFRIIHQNNSVSNLIGSEKENRYKRLLTQLHRRIAAKSLTFRLSNEHFQISTLLNSNLIWKWRMRNFFVGFATANCNLSILNEEEEIEPILTVYPLCSPLD